MDTESVAQTEAASSPEPIILERAKFGDRFFAAVVDNIILNIPLRILLFFLIPLWGNPYFGLFFGLSIQFIVVLGYFAVFAYKRGGQTLGKSWNKVKVVDLLGNDLSLGHFVVREFIARGTFLIATLFFGYYGYIWILTYLLALTKERRALHDIIVGTQVIKVK